MMDAELQAMKQREVVGGLDLASVLVEPLKYTVDISTCHRVQAQEDGVRAG